MERPSEIGVGAFLPTFLLPDGPPRRRLLLDFAREGESLGFDSLWVTDHLLRATQFYQVPWLEPLDVLSFVAAATERVRLGTGILILPLRDPVLLAKEICALHDLSDGRFILGAGTGWFEDEFAAVGRSKRHRGQLTDEILDLLELLLTRESVTYQGRHFQVENVSVDPRPSVRPPFWIAGGSQFPHEASPETPVLAEPVLRRIQRGDGWVTRPTALPEQIREDWARIEPAIRTRERGSDGFVVAHENFVHVVDTDDREEALEAQRAAYTGLMGERRPFEYFEAVYLTGTPAEIVDRLVARVEAGVEYVMLHPLVADPSQLELWWNLIVGPLRERGGKRVG
jgi:probable F420-dependent oxidoreductase